MAEPTTDEILQVRYTLGQFTPDAASAARLPDAIIRFLWTQAEGGGVLETAVLAAEALARTSADSFPFSADGQSLDVSKRISNWTLVADRLRRQLAGRTSTVSLTRAAAVTAADQWAAE